MSELDNSTPTPDDLIAIEQEPDTGIPPKNIRTTRRIGERLCVAGQGPKPARLMFLATSVLEEEAAETQYSHYGRNIRQKPRYLKGAPGSILTDVAQMCGIDMRQCYYTAMVKWLLPKAHRDKPKKDEIAWSMEVLDNEIKEVKPDIIVTLGKAPFDFLTGLKVPLKDIKGAWFRSDRFNCRVFPMDKITFLVSKPEYIEKFRVELLEVRKMLNAVEGTPVYEVPRHYTTTENLQQVTELVEMWHDNSLNVQSVDCEWGGNNHVDGRLRSIQFCWAEGYATYIKFRDEKAEFVFDAPYDEVGARLGMHLNRPEVKYVGHHIAADFPWMSHYLGLEWYDKCIMDTEFGQQCVDEYEDLGLERMSIKYTDCGRYDIPVMLWYKKNKGSPTDGYAYVPDDILPIYGCYDVDVPFRTYPKLQAALAAQRGLLQYFYSFFLPFVTNIFTQFALTGLPMNKDRMDELRKLFSYARDAMNMTLQGKITTEADQLMLRAFMKADPTKGILAYAEIVAALQEAKPDRAFHLLKTAFGIDKLKELQVFLDHRLEAPTFNIRSTDQMRRWLFEVKGLTPIKSTNRKEQGFPSMAWDKVLSYSPEKQKEFSPSTDKQTLEILGQKDDLIGELLELNAVGNICKAFLKEPTIDDDTGELTRENGLHFWLANDGRIHGQMSTTETGRPRCWKPNTLNFPKYVTKKISGGIKKLLQAKDAEGSLPEEFRHYLTTKVPSIRSCIDAAPLLPLPGSQGWCLIESDYQTAEVRALAFISGDQQLIDLITLPDKNFAVLQDGETVVRIGFAGTELLPEKFYDVLFSIYEKGKFVRKVPLHELKIVNGSLVHPKADLHWALAEDTHKFPREILDKNKDRDPAKIVRFCIAEGELLLTRRGLVPIEQLLGCDELWDGIEWVHHEGVICTGVKEVHYYQGLWATDGHNVYTEGGDKIPFGDARKYCHQLAGVEGPCESAQRKARPADLSRNGAPHWKWIFQGDDAVSSLRHQEREGSQKPGEGIVEQVLLSKRTEVSRQARCLIGGAIRSYQAALYQFCASRFSKLRRAWDNLDVQEQEGVHKMGLGKMAKCLFQRNGVRSSEQRWALLQTEPAFGSPQSEHIESPYRSSCDDGRGQENAGDSSGIRDDSQNCALSLTGRLDRGRAPGASQEQPQGGGPAEDPKRIVRVYDVINAGPRHRYVCSGVLVSNSGTYGASGNTLDRKIESDTGMKPEPGTGDRTLAALQAKQPVATQHQAMIKTYPENPGYYQAASGRIRHFRLHPENVYAISSRQRDSILAALGREALNFPYQEIVAATAARAANRLLRFYRDQGMFARPMVVLYDAIVTLAPVEERFIVKGLHQKYMTDENNWEHHGREWNFPIDSSFSYAWAGEPTPEQQEKLDDPAWASDPSVLPPTAPQGLCK